MEKNKLQTFFGLVVAFTLFAVCLWSLEESSIPGTAVYFDATHRMPVSSKFVDTTGAVRGYSVTDEGLPQIMCKPYAYDIAEGNIASHVTYVMFGLNSDIDNAQEDLWEPGGTYVFPTIASQMRVVSSNATDTSNGNGIQAVHIEYLDGSYIAKETIATLTGTAPAYTTATDIFRVNRFHAQNTGQTKTAVGNISLTNNAGTITYGYISAGNTHARQAIFTVPASKTFYIIRFNPSGSVSSTNWCDFNLRADFHKNLNNTFEMNGGGFFSPMEVALLSSTSGLSNSVYVIPFKVPQKATVKVTGLSSASNANAVCEVTVRGWIEDYED